MDSQSLEQSLAALEDRVRALEQTVTVLKDARAIDERVTASAPAIPVAAVIDALSPQPLPPAVKNLVQAAAQPSTLTQVARSSWLAFDMVHELITVGRMLLDPHYHTAWITRFLVIAFAIALFISSWWVPLSGVSVIGPLINKLADLVLAGILFLALFCETRRYKEWRLKAPRP
jgi:hypothetical protein